MRRLIPALCALSLAAPVLAQDEAAPLDVTVVEELVARPATPGPAWWKVSDADSAVYIMTAPWTAPKGLAWDRTVLERRMNGANVYISPLDFSLLDPRSIVGMGGVLMNAPKLLMAPKVKPEPRPVKPLEETLPPETRARFVAMRDKLGQPDDRYAAMTPLEASRAIGQDYRRHYPLVELDVATQVEQAARRHRVRVTPAYRVKVPATGYTVQSERADPAHGAACLDRTMTEVESQRAQAVRLGDAWARGDVRPMLAANSPLVAPPRRDKLNCFNGGSVNVSSGSKLAQRLEEEYVAGAAGAVERALRTPGRSVALLPLMSPFGNVEAGMLGRRGVLARLKAKGYVVTTPPGLEGQ